MWMNSLKNLPQMWITKICFRPHKQMQTFLKIMCQESYMCFVVIMLIQTSASMY